MWVCHKDSAAFSLILLGPQIAEKPRVEEACAEGQEEALGQREPDEVGWQCSRASTRTCTSPP